MSTLYILNRLDHQSAFIDGDPRLRDLYNRQMPLNSAPKVSNIGVGQSLGYKSFGDISGGDIVYYLDKEVNVAFPPAIFGNAVTTQYTTAPLTPLKDILIPYTPALPDPSIVLPDMRREAQFRTDIMSKQQTPRNMQRPLFITSR